MRIKLSDPALVSELLDYLARRELAAKAVGANEVVVALPDRISARNAELEVELSLRIWQAMHSNAKVTRVA